MKRVTLDGKDYLLPENWQECDRDDMAVITELLYMNRLEETKFWLSLSLNLLAVRNKKILWRYLRTDRLAKHAKESVRRVFRDRMIENKDRLYQVSKSLRWVLERPTATVPLYPELCHGRYLCARPGLTDLRYIDFVQAESACREFYREDGNLRSQEEALVRLMCALYAPVSPQGSRKPIPEDDAKSRKRMEADMAQVPLQAKLAVLVFFESCSALLQDEFPRIFSSSEDESQGESRFGPVGLIIEVAGDKFGDVDRTAEANLYTLLTYLEKEAIKYDEFKRKYKK